MEGGRDKEDEQDGISVHSPCKAPPSSASSLPKEQQEVELELRLLEALEIYPPVKLRGTRASPLCTLWSDGIPAEKVCSASCPSLDRHFSPDEVLQLLDRFYNLEVLKPDDEEIDILNHEEDFCLPQSYFVKEEP
ncbi:putative 14-3-3 protein [Hibiscus syriacus]|uniref:14-3-3 protein n=1 Tax=Hibiscus syriacus TaxID=106335 RepID=A0A6A2YVE0_HIBSY|nr:putative 14-3-3 protein [Hibiscus syriacus]